MSQIMKSFTAVFLVLFMGMTAVGILGMFATVLHAQDTHERIVDDLEDSNFYPTVIKAAFLESASRGYRLKVTLYNASGGVLELTSYTEGMNVSDVVKARVELAFATRIPFLGADWQQKLVGYAR